MPDYSKAKIYKIEHKSDPDIKIYIGATCQSLSARFTEHKKDFKRWINGLKERGISSFELFEAYGTEQLQIILLEDFPCENKEQLTAKEAEWIRKSNCLNKVIPGRTPQEYEEENRDKRREYKKEHREQRNESSKLRLV